MNPIISIDQLTEALDDSDPLEHARIMKRIKISAHELTPFATWAEQGYTRNCLARTSEYELILLCWEIGAKTPIHDHGGEDCWVYQVQGTVEEIRFQETAGNLIEVNRSALIPGKLTYMNDRMGYHTIVNNSTRRAMTLHIYASPIDSCNVFCYEKDCFEVKEMSYNSCKGNEAESLVS